MSELAATSDRPRARARARVTKSERTRAAILDAALEFLWTRPFRELTVNGLMSAVPAGRSAFYQYFEDLHGLMQTLLSDLEAEILSVANPWLAGGGERTEALRTSLAELVRVCHARGPILRATAEAAVGDARTERSWNALLERFDVAVAERIEADQEAGLVPPLDARAVAMAFNRMDAHLFIHAFGQHPRQPPGPVLEAITTIWVSTLYGHLPAKDLQSQLR